MSYRTVGTCGNCGGAVCVPEIWMGIFPPTPTCSSCGAVPENAHGPKMAMRPRGQRAPGRNGEVPVTFVPRLR